MIFVINFENHIELYWHNKDKEYILGSYHAAYLIEHLEEKIQSKEFSNNKFFNFFGN